MITYIKVSNLIKFTIEVKQNNALEPDSEMALCCRILWIKIPAVFSGLTDWRVFIYRILESISFGINWTLPIKALIVPELPIHSYMDDPAAAGMISKTLFIINFHRHFKRGNRCHGKGSNSYR